MERSRDVLQIKDVVEDARRNFSFQYTNYMMQVRCVLVSLCVVCCTRRRPCCFSMLDEAGVVDSAFLYSS